MSVFGFVFSLVAVGAILGVGFGYLPLMPILLALAFGLFVAAALFWREMSTR